MKQDFLTETEIPSMGGAEIGVLLKKLAREAPANTSIIEVGCWLGAGTIPLASGIRERQSQGSVQLHCFDRWQANEAEIEKAARQGVHLTPGEDLLPHIQRALKPLDVPVNYHKGDIREAHWSEGPISVYVDDASKIPKLFYHSLATFGPYWVAGSTIILLMDYNLWRKTGDERHKCQKHFIEGHRDHFEAIPNEFGEALFRYVKPLDFSHWRSDTEADSPRKLSPDLYAAADQIPSMGGTKLGPLLRRLARNARSGTAIVEVGAWLGAGTAQLAVGILEREKPDVALHCFDRWLASPSEAAKAGKQGWTVEASQDTLPLFNRALSPFNVPLFCHKLDLMDARWDGTPISVYVDDASKAPNLFYHALETFGPSWVPGETIIVLMDFHLWQKTGDKRHECQKDFIEFFSDHFQPIGAPNKATFRYVMPLNFDPETLAAAQRAIATHRKSRFLKNAVVFGYRGFRRLLRGDRNR